MDFTEVYQVMTRKGLLNDPAFATLDFDIEPIPRFNGCPLGLYFPFTEYIPEFGRVIPEGTIILPPESQEGTLLHELGHRYGEYYYNDLSEAFAENFRKRYQGGRALLYLGLDFHRVPSFGCLFEEGERGAAEFALFEPLNAGDVALIEAHLNSCGEKARVLYGNGEVPWLRVEFTQGVDWMPIIASVMAASAAAVLGVLGYAIYKMAKESPWVYPVAILGTGLFILSGLALGARVGFKELKAAKASYK